MKKAFPILLVILLFALTFGVDFVLAGGDVSSQVNTLLEAGAKKAQFGEAQDPRSVIEGVITIVLGLMGTIFMVLIALGAYHFFSAAGDETKVKKGTAYMRNAAIGLAIVLMSYSITLFVAQGVQEAVNPGSTAGGPDPANRVICCDIIYKGVILDDAPLYDGDNTQSIIVNSERECTSKCTGAVGAPDTCIPSTLSRQECLSRN